jgi:Concanavalin A-like lectin/glucanases superfamily
MVRRIRTLVCSTTLAPLAALALAGVAGCRSREAAPAPRDEQAELWALLRDGELRGPAFGALEAAAPDVGDVPPDGALAGFPFSKWSFDDCNPSRTNLADASFRGNTAFRSVAVACAPGVAGQAVAIAAKEDIVYVPDQPDFTFEEGVTVAGWFKPGSIGTARTLFRKRDKGTSSFALVLNANGKYQFVVNLGDKAVSVTSPQPAKLGVFQHVAGSYDGATVRLYVDGFEVKGLGALGEIAPGAGPVLIGNDGSERRFDGVIDDAFFEGRALSNDEVRELTCVRSSPTMAVTPRVSAPTPPGTPASFDVAVTNHNSAACDPLSFQFFLNFFPSNSNVSVEPTSAFEPSVAGGETAHFTMTATASELAEPSTVTIPFEVFSFNQGQSFFAFDAVDFVVAEPAGCHVSTSRELMIKKLSVVDDPIRTTSFGAPGDPRSGVWTFKHLVESMAPTPADAPAMVEEMLATFTTQQTVNGFTITPRPGMQSLILDQWPRTPDGALDLAQAPLRLQAIVNRFDLRDLGAGDAGEARFVFAFNFPGSFFFPLQATMIFEYKLPASTEGEVLDWAQSFHALGATPFSEEYNAALQTLTERFAGRGARPGHPNGSALSAVRTNEIDFGDNFTWQLREFRLSPATGRLAPSTLELTPDRSFNNSAPLASFINTNAAAIIAETHEVPEQLDGQPFRAGAVFNDLNTWFAPGVADNEARHHLALNTCNGCHSSAETGTFFLHVKPRFFGDEAGLSGFLTGITVNDPVTGQPRTFNELARRSADLKAVVCSDPAAP